MTRGILPLSLALMMSTASPAFALHTQEDCTDADPISLASPDLQNFFSTPRDQGDLGSCYAYAAADLVTFALGTPISALDLDFLYEGNESQNIISQFLGGNFGNSGTYSGGQERQVLSEGISAGFCPESMVPSSSGFENTDENDEELAEEISAVADNDVPQGEDSSVSLELISEVFPSLDPGQVVPLASSLSNQNINEMMKSLTLLACPSTKRLKLPSQYSVVDNISFLSLLAPIFQDSVSPIDAALALGTIAGIMIHVNPLLTPSQISPGSDQHVVVIQGRHWENGQCWYTLRNSWGPSVCDDYQLDPNSLTCDPNSGLAQITESKLSSVLLEVAYLKHG